MGYTKSLSQDWKATLRSLSLCQEVPSLPPTLRNLPNKSLERVLMQTRFQTIRQNQRQSLRQRQNQSYRGQDWKATLRNMSWGQEASSSRFHDVPSLPPTHFLGGMIQTCCNSRAKKTAPRSLICWGGVGTDFEAIKI